MEDEELGHFRQAGKIASKVREESRSLIMVEASFLDIAETIEQMIVEEGGRPAFPVNISINSIAAHYTPEAEATGELGEKDVVKIDLGVELHGALSDTAYTVDLGGESGELVKAADDALAAAITAIRPGVKVGAVGGVIEDLVTGRGFKPISNLTGHMIKSNDLHAGVDIPNVRTEDPYEFAPGDVFAVEPFVTTGGGYVTDLNQVEIFSLHSPSMVRMRQSRKIVEYVVNNYGMLPFAERWIRKEFPSRVLVGAALRELLQNHFIQGYPVLREVDGGMVAQSEHTILVTESGCDVLTK